MTTSYAAMLRGINVGAKTKVSMADLRAALVDLGLDDVSTYIQSGNVIFRSSISPSELPPAIEHAIDGAFGLTVKVVLRTSAQLTGVVKHNPLAAAGRDLTKLHVTFLASQPAAARMAHIEAEAFLPDEIRVLEREVYLHCPAGYGRTKLNNAFFERTLGVPATTRNLRTVTVLADMTSDGGRLPSGGERRLSAGPQLRLTGTTAPPRTLPP